MPTRTPIRPSTGELMDVLLSLGVPAERRDPDVMVGGRWWNVVELVHPTVEEVVPHARPGALVIADRLSAEARDALDAAGAAWMDRRGALCFPGSPPLAGSFEALLAPPERVSEPFTGAGLDLVVAMLGEPERSWGVQELARVTGRSPGRVSEILGVLRDDGLVDPSNRPLVPELFWEAADAWRPRWLPIPTLPAPGPGMVASGTKAAVARGAPLIVTSDSPVELYVADRRTLERLRSHKGGGGGRQVAAVCPSRWAVHHPPLGAPDVAGFSTADVVVLALDLARDRGRGREVLEAWTPAGGGRVW